MSKERLAKIKEISDEGLRIRILITRVRMARHPAPDPDLAVVLVDLLREAVDRGLEE